MEWHTTKPDGPLNMDSKTTIVRRLTDLSEPRWNIITHSATGPVAISGSGGQYGGGVCIDFEVVDATQDEISSLEINMPST